eukprot:jgi/Undpi1/9765/HiC_scaffold_27.g12221.m1
MLHRSSARAIANSALVTRHRFISSGSSTAAGKGRGKRSGSPTAVEAVEVTETVPAGPAGGSKAEQGTVKLDICGDIEEEEEEMEEMVQDGPAGKEWGGPTRGGVLGEPTRFGDWERKGRCSDF